MNVHKKMNGRTDRDPAQAVSRDPETWKAAKDPDEIEQEIARTRAALSASLGEVERRLTLKHFAVQGIDRFRSSMAEKFDGRAVFSVLRRNLGPLGLLGIGLGWLVLHN